MGSVEVTFTTKVVSCVDVSLHSTDFELEQTYPRGVCLLKSREEGVGSWHARALEGGRRDTVASRTTVEMEFQPAVARIVSISLIGFEEEIWNNSRITNSCSQRVRAECKSSTLSHINDMRCPRINTRRQRKQRNQRLMHFYLDRGEIN
jgi:hypothetical protein